MMLVGAFLGDEALRYNTEPITVPATLGLDEIEEQVCSCHGPTSRGPFRYADRTGRRNTVLIVVLVTDEGDPHVL